MQNTPDLVRGICFGMFAGSVEPTMTILGYLPGLVAIEAPIGCGACLERLLVASGAGAPAMQPVAIRIQAILDVFAVDRLEVK